MTKTITNSEIEARVERAKSLFRDGYNCCQAVFAACADLYDFPSDEWALKVSASFGGGIGRMRMVCGAASGMFLLAGLENGVDATKPIADAKKDNYALVQRLAEQFKAEHGSLICADLLGIAPKPDSPQPAERNEAYYHKRPCVEMVGQAVRIYLEQMMAPSQDPKTR